MPCVDNNLVDKVIKLKKQKNAIILAHYYQENDIQDCADFIGDSLALSQQAAKTNADIILFAGVLFMAETAKILNPAKKVILPDMLAGCSLVEQCSAEALKSFKDKHPGHVLITYINCSAEVKAISDIICTSANALRVVNSVPKSTPIIFAPDKNLGKYVQKQSGRELILWDGSCEVHTTFDLVKILKIKEQNPDAKIIAHPECSENILDVAHHIGSTTSLIEYTKSSSATNFIVATEPGVIYQMKKLSPQKTFIPAPAESGESCNVCPHMRLNTMQKIYDCLINESPEITIPESIRKLAYLPIEKMLALG